MRLHDLVDAENIIIQILWGEKTIEFPTEVVETHSDGVYVTPYLHNGMPLELNINMYSGIICNVFGDAPDNGRRISWRNVDLSTAKYKSEMVYFIKTSAFNSVANTDERRVEDRVKITKEGSLFDSVKTVPIRINDISDSGIAFYAPSSFEPATNAFTVYFKDEVNGQKFDLSIKCKQVRTKKMPGTVFYGCKISADNKEYLIYGCLTRLMKNAKKNAEAEEALEEANEEANEEARAEVLENAEEIREVLRDENGEEIREVTREEIGEEIKEKFVEAK